MSVDVQAYVTKEGLQKLKEELKELKTVKRKEIAWRIQEAKELGDLSENAEYAEAKNEQAFIEGRIIEIENMLKNVAVITSGQADGFVRVGSTITLKYDSSERQYTIVGSNEADPSKGLISNESPLGQAFLGCKVGDTVDVKVPAGVVKYKIVAIK
ncbi:MAG: transcription elongation factor GreA [Candidatus Kerfeldbacteria bacterium]|nr:transcription elongation factor GreA [Candidatus Kerfeldbacteria bacterium]